MLNYCFKLLDIKKLKWRFLADTKYEVNLQWNKDTKGTLSSPVLPNKIEVATFLDCPKGIGGICSPEDLFEASINACLMVTF